jgi:hypothetical protein
MYPVLTDTRVRNDDKGMGLQCVHIHRHILDEVRGNTVEKYTAPLYNCHVSLFVPMTCCFD